MTEVSTPTDQGAPGRFALAKPQTDTIIVGFDSAWTDSSKVPGAICAIAFDKLGKAEFLIPRLVSFSQALEFIDQLKQEFSLCLVTLDQPTIVPNKNGSRPVEKVAASVISFVGGGVQPSNRSKIGMFDDDAPVWSFKLELDAIEDPEASRSSQSGLFLVEVFPALALTGLNESFSQRLGAPKYNPQNRKKFQLKDWQAVASTVAGHARALEVLELSDWASNMRQLAAPTKSDQDCLDASICALVGLIWRTCDNGCSTIIGDTVTGYMVTPISQQTRSRLELAAASKRVPIT